MNLMRLPSTTRLKPLQAWSDGQPASPGRTRRTKREAADKLALAKASDAAARIFKKLRRSIPSPKKTEINILVKYQERKLPRGDER